MAADCGPRALENIEKEMTCALCLSLFEEPKTLPACLHTFCKSCLVRAEAARRRRLGGPAQTSTTNQVECPQCRSVSSTESGAESLTTNFMYANIIQHLKSGDSEFASGNLQKTRPEPLMCPKHPDEKLKLFCFDCEVVICRDCIVIDHRDHRFSFVRDVAVDERESLTRLVSPLTEQLARLSRARDSAQVARTELERAVRERAERIEAEFNKCLQKIEERRRHFLELSQVTSEMKMRVVDQQSCELGTLHSQVTEFVQGTREELQQASDVEVFMRRRAIRERVEDLSKLCQSAPLETTERDRAGFVVDTGCLEGLGEMVELPCPETSFAEDLTQVNPVQNEETTVSVVAQNPEGHALIHGGGVCTALTSITVATTGRINVEEANVVDNRDGSYTVGFTPSHPGTLSLDILFDRQPIQGSPFELQVKRNYTNITLEPLAFPVANANPWGVALLGDSELAVTSSDGVVRVYTKKGELVDSIRSNFVRPYGICTDGEGALWVTDREAHNVQNFRRDPNNGKFKKIFQFGVRGVTPGQFSHPRGIAVHPTTGLVYISDMKNNRVQIFSPSHPLPLYRSHFGGPGKTPGLFDLPAGLCFDHHDNLLVCDDKNSRVQVFDQEGRFLRLLGATTTSHRGVLCSPISVACDKHGRSIITEFGSHTISILSAEGQTLSCVRNLGSELGQLVHPRGVACDSLGFIFVADHDNARIVCF